VRARIRLEERSDRASSLEVERAAFDSEEEPGVIEAVRDEPGSFAVVAEEDGEIVGHVQFSRGWIGEASVVALGPVGVLPDRQRRGIGSDLIREGLAEAARRGERIAIVLGGPDYYRCFGFEPGLGVGLRNPFAGELPGGFVIAEEDFMVATLGERTEPLHGDVRLHPAFGQAG
jgi:predicted N-acetyltransferase YhbS